MILAPKTSTGLWRIRVKDVEYEIDKSQLTSLANAVNLKTSVNSFLSAKGFQIDVYYNPPETPIIWIGSVNEIIPNQWWITKD